MYIVPEKDIAALVGAEDSFEAVRQVFGAMAAGSAYNFPVIREAIGHADALYGFKSGFDRQGLNLGLKSGGYWPGNTAKGLTNHQSTVFLFDAETGKCRAIVGGNLLTALRTAAAAAVSVACLARENARVLGIVGAGHQAAFQLRAVAAQRRFERVVAWNRSPEKLARLGAVARKLGLDFEAVSLQELGAQADVIVTITSSYAAILADAHVKPGTHIACMGTDTKGKQEVEAALVARASLFTDEVAQSVSIGEWPGLSPFSCHFPVSPRVQARHRQKGYPRQLPVGLRLAIWMRLPRAGASYPHRGCQPLVAPWPHRPCRHRI